MKKKLTRALALMLMLCMLLPQTALAYTTYYIEVAISDENGKSVRGESSHYGTLATPLATEVVGIVMDRYDELETVFARTGLRGIVDTGVEAFRDGDAAWSEYVDTYYEDANGAFKDILMDQASTYADLTVNHQNVLTYVDEDGGMTYTVTITLHTWSNEDDDDDDNKHNVVVKPVAPAEPEQPGQPAEPVKKGEVKTSHSKADKSEVVTITVKPEEGWVVNQVTVVDRSGTPVITTAIDNETYTFVMPNGDVTVASTFSVEPRPVFETGVDQMLKVEEIAYMRGKDDGNFHPTAAITRAEVATMFYRLLKNVDVDTAPVFTDVNRDAWYTAAIDTLAAYGIVNGMTEDTFEPDSPITRAQFVAICARFARTSAEGRTFEDVPADHWAAGYISTAASYGWINGISDTEFAPDRPITRAEAAAMVNRVLARIPDRGYIDSQPQRYEDVVKLNWAWYDISEASFGELPR